MKKISDKQKLKKQVERDMKERMLSVFLDIWMKRRHYSELSGKWLGKEALTTFFHHILPKSKYPQAMLDEENIILITFDEHSKVESDPTFFEEINKRREKLKEKYGRS